MSQQQASRVTIAQIAAQAGVSVPTVSKVLNGRPGVAAETRRRVEGLLRQHDYTRRVARPRPSAHLIDLVFDRLDTPWALEVLLGVEPTMRAAGLATVVADDHNDPKSANTWFTNLASRHSDGVIFAVAHLSRQQRTGLELLKVPYVVVDPVGRPDPTVPTIGVTNRAGALAATEHLLALGHRRIGLLGGPPGLLCSRARLHGYRNAMANAGVPLAPELITSGDFRTDVGYRQARQVLAQPAPPTALFAASDQQALGAYDAVRDVGLRVPHDVSIVGFDDLPGSSQALPRLTTVRQPIRQMAVTAARMLLQMINRRALPALSIELATTLIVRESTARLR